MAKHHVEKTCWLGLLLLLATSLLFWHMAPPQGLSLPAWHSAIIFMATIVAIVLKVLPLGAIGFIGITLFALTNAAGSASSTGAMETALGEFKSPLLWLVVVAFLIARGFIKTGLGRRIALLLVSLFGKRTLGLAYSLAATDLILAPAMPSNVARCGGVIYPIASALARNFDSNPEDASRKKIGTFLILCVSNVNDITSTLFMTAYAGNLIAVKLAGDAGVDLSWGKWLVAASVPCLFCLLLIPVVVYWLTNPEIKQTPNAPALARAELQQMGRISRGEGLMLGTFILLLGLWIFGGHLGIDATQTACIGLSILLLSGVLTWEEVKSEKGAWDTLVWFSALLMMANMIKTLGFTTWLGDHIGSTIGSWMGGVHWLWVLLVLNTAYFYIHYFFASGNAQIAALYSVFLMMGIQLGIPALPATLMLAFTSGLFCSITQYASARGPILFGSGFVPTGIWWRVGFIVSVIHQVIFMTIGLLWWKFLGYY